MSAWLRVVSETPARIATLRRPMRLRKSNFPKPSQNSVSDAGCLAIDGNAPEYRALPDSACHFEVYRADEIRTSSVLFAGGDWHWQLSDAAGEILVEAGGYRSQVDCRKAVAMLRRHVPFALLPTRA